MKKKKFLSLIVCALLTATSMAQSAKDKIESQSRDPKTAENAAKADDHIINKKIITDTSVQESKNINPAKSRSGRKKKTSCKSK